jgi:hypothetical protein
LQPHRRRERGITIIAGILLLVLFIALASLAVDLGRVQLAKTELRQAADAAARYAAKGLADGSWQRRASDAGSDNKVDGVAVAIPPQNVISGNWNAKSSPRFSTSLYPTNAVQVTAERSKSSGNAVPLWFASIVGIDSCNLRSVAIAAVMDYPSGFIGLEGFTVKNNLRSAGYSSATNPNPTWATCDSPGMLGSNASISAGNNEVVGLVILGYEGTHNLSLATPAEVLKTAIPTPAVDFSGAPASNPGGVPTDLHVKSDMTLQSGTYYFTRIAVDNNADINFNGPATVYIDGDVQFSQDNGVYAYQRIPANLRIFMRGTGTSFGGSNANNITVVADITAPQTNFQVNNNALLIGAATFRTITVKNNAEFYYDESLNKSLGISGGAVVLVQ